MSLIDVIPHPQAVFVGYAEDDVRLAAMRRLVAGSLLLPEGDLGERRALDLDLWVHRGGEDTPQAPDHMHVLVVASMYAGLIKTNRGGSSLTYSATNASPTMRIPSGLGNEVERLVRHELVPWLQGAESRPVLTRSTGSTGGWGSGYASIAADDDDVQFVPFLFDADDKVIAGAFRRYGPQDTWVWMLPHDPPRPELWLAAALRDWHERTPDRIPYASPWQRRVRWMTRDEIDGDRALNDLETRRQAWENQYALQREALEAKILRARLDAEQGPRRLLAENDEGLVSAVSHALAILGYEVGDEDVQRKEESRGKAHDLNVKDPDAPASVVIAEVKGFSKGARGALSQAQQHILRFAVTHAGRTPDACWLIVNHFRNLDPDERPTLLRGADEDIKIFADNGGLLIDTRDLFTMVRRVEDGQLAKAEARRLLREATARLEIPTEWAARS